MAPSSPSLPRPPPDPPPGRLSPVPHESLSLLEPPEPPDPPDLPSDLVFPSVLLIASAISSSPVLPQFLDLDFRCLDSAVASGFSSFLASPDVRRSSSRRRLASPSRRLSTEPPLPPCLTCVVGGHMWKSSLALKPPLAFQAAGACPVTHSDLPLVFPQVSSYSSISASPLLDCSENFVVSVALVLWNMDSLPLIANGSGTVLFVLCMGSLIASVRFVTAVCRFLSVFSSAVIALISFSMWQVGKSSVSSSPVNLVLDFHCPLFSVKEIILLPNTLVSSGIVLGSNVLKAALSRTETTRLFVSRSAFYVVGGLTFSAVEAWIPPLGGLDQDSKYCFCLIVLAWVELASSPLSLYLILSCCFIFCTTNLLVVVAFVCWLLVACCISSVWG